MLTVFITTVAVAYSFSVLEMQITYESKETINNVIADAFECHSRFLGLSDCI